MSVETQHRIVQTMLVMRQLGDPPMVYGTVSIPLALGAETLVRTAVPIEVDSMMKELDAYPLAIWASARFESSVKIVDLERTDEAGDPLVRFRDVLRPDEAVVAAAVKAAMNAEVSKRAT